MNIQTMTDIELKASGYDQLALIEHYQANLRTINQELAKRNEPVEEVTPKDVEKK